MYKNTTISYHYHNSNKMLLLSALLIFQQYLTLVNAALLNC